MQPTAIPVWTLLPRLLLVPAGYASGQAPPIGWPESVARLTDEGSKAETAWHCSEATGSSAYCPRPIGLCKGQGRDRRGPGW
jgi:hypothetical protein